MSEGRLLAFVGVVAVIVIVPGPDMAFVTRNALRYGLRAALASALGIEAGLVVWAGASALGLAALLRASGTAFSIVKIAVRRWIERVTGVALVTFGVRLAFARR